MLKTLITFLFIIFTLISALGQDTLFCNVLFNVDSDRAIDSELKKLDSILTQIENLQSVSLSGHTDKDGSNEYNIALSKRRVYGVKQYLTDKINISINEEYFGENKPVSSNNDEFGKKINRRVEVTIIYKKPTKVSSLTLQDVYDELSVSSERIRFPTDRDTILLLEKGTVINIPANTFYTSSNFAFLEAKEVYSYIDMLGEQLSTTSNGELLETGGMVKLNVYDESGDEINAQNNINIFMPSADFKEDMQLFYGEHDSLNIMNWELNDSTSGAVGAVFFPNDFLVSLNIPPIELRECNTFYCKLRRFFYGFGFRSQEERFANYSDIIVFNDSIQSLMDSLGVTNIYELRNVLRNQRVEEGKGSSSEVSYYGFSTTKLDWINCDRFTNIRPLIAMKTDVLINKDISLSLVFKDLKSIFPASRMANELAFVKVPSSYEVYYVAIQMKENKVLLSIVETEISNNAPAIEFEEIELNDLRNRLERLE